MSDVLNAPAEPPAEPTPGSGKGRKRVALAASGAVLLAAAAGGGVWAYSAYFGQGDQPSQALPAKGLLAYASLDLDPSGEQKIAAVRTLNKFPGFEEEVDLGSEDDIREKVFELMQEDGVCADLDFAKDVNPWLGDRFGFGLLDLDKDEPAPVAVVQVKDEGAAEKGLEKLAECDPSGSGEGGYALADGWAILAETDAIAKDVVKAAEKGSLADDEDFQHWTKAPGDAGIISLYAAPAAGEALYEELSTSGEAPPSMKKYFSEFTGAGGAIRFSGGSVEAEFVAGQGDDELAELVNENGAAAAASLPTTTAAALGLGLAEGWLDTLLDFYGPELEKEAGMSVDDLEKELEAQTGLTKDDLETLLGESLAIAVDAGFEADAIMEGDFAKMPVGIKIKGDTDEIEKVVEKVQAKLAEFGAPDDFLQTATTGDYVVIGVSEDYVAKLEKEDGLSGSDLYGKVVPSDETSSVFFLNFDAGDHWLDSLLEDLDAPAEVTDNVKPLQGFGISSWVEGDEGHSLLTLTTD